MASVTCDSDAGLGERSPGPRADLIAAFETAARTALDSYGVRLWLVEVLGSRWSYVAGPETDAPMPRALSRIALDDRLGIVADGWDQLPESCRTEFLGSLRRLLHALGA
ncbi:MAG: hypothetical protein V2A58_13340 [Planctomycetota bacterium]